MNYLKQESFGFRFEDVNNYLDKHIAYLDNIYCNFKNMIEDYRKETSSIKIKEENDPIEQLKILSEEDKIRFNGRYAALIDEFIILLSTDIADAFNKNEYLKFKMVLIEKISLLFDAIQNPDELVDLNEIENIIDCEMPKYDNMTNYYYSKLLEYQSNNEMDKLMIEYFRDKIKPFNSNVTNKLELFCLVKAHKYFCNKK